MTSRGLGRGTLIFRGQEYPVSNVDITIEEPDPMRSHGLINSAAAALAISGLLSAGAATSDPEQHDGPRTRTHKHWRGGKRHAAGRYKGSRAARRKTDHRRHKK